MCFIYLLLEYCKMHNKCFDTIRQKIEKADFTKNTMSICYLDVVGKVPYVEFKKALDLKKKSAKFVRKQV